jgi:hypothetical protein
MKDKQCKHIDELPILELLNRVPRRENGERHWAFLGPRIELDFEAWFVMEAMPEWVNGKLALAKMRSLIDRGLVTGCTCGCRGDFVITRKGERRLRELVEVKP